MLRDGRSPIVLVVMSSKTSSSSRAEVVIVGGGVAALEAALALRALAGDLVHTTLASADAELTYRPSAAFEAFGHPIPPRCELGAIASDLGANFRLGRLEAVAPQTRSLRLSSGIRLEYDALILSTGARATTSVPGALTFRDQRDIPALRRTLGELEAGSLNRLAFAVPSGVTWTLPLYELALLSAVRGELYGGGTEVVLVTPEHRPLEVFGEEASMMVAEVLADRGVRFIGESPTIRWSDGRLAIQGDAPIRADRVITVPQLRVNRIAGIPASWWGFVPTDASGRVDDLTDVYAAGDMTTYPIKQGGLATQQADRIAHTIAGSLGVPVKELHSSHVLRARLLGGQRPLMLRTELDWRGRPLNGTVEAGDPASAADTSKIFGRYLTPYLESLGFGREHTIAA
jgi:sulfide:quinone oxidoreductase